MLTRDHRLAKIRDFNLLIKHGYWVNGTFLSMRVLKLAKIRNYFPKKENPDNFEKQLRLAINIGTKVSKSAVKRNRLKRQISEVLRLLLKSGKITEGHYLMFTAKATALTKTYAEISQEVELLLRREKLF